jgi:dUTP pyrophosphatase
MAKIVVHATQQLSKANPTDAGWDVASAEDVMIYGGQSKLIVTDLRIAIPTGWSGILKSRSGLSVKNKIEVGAGVIDAGYRGFVKVHLYNNGLFDFPIKVGDRIAQLTFIEVPEVEWIVTFDLPDADRGDNGFGSSGV